MNRRSFMGTLTGVGVASVGVLLSVPLLRFALYPMFLETSGTGWSDLGAVAELKNLTFPTQRSIKVEQLDGWRKVVSERTVYIIQGADGMFRVLSPVCPHLGCMIGWDVSRKQFVSPCHGGIFNSDGTLVAGPPRRAMDELESKVEQDHLLVRYQYFQPLLPTKQALS